MCLSLCGEVVDWERWVMRELRRGFLGREEVVMRDLKDFYVLLVLRVDKERWRVDLREVFWLWVRVLEG